MLHMHVEETLNSNFFCAPAAAVRVQASSKEHVPVAISGAGIAGLATAVALHKVHLL
jgi:predicted NAD/FAD-binding protein